MKVLSISGGNYNMVETKKRKVTKKRNLDKYKIKKENINKLLLFVKAMEKEIINNE